MASAQAEPEATAPPGGLSVLARPVRWLAPATIVALFLAVYLGAVLWRAQGDPLAFVRLGDGFVRGQPLGELGYDGQFAYWIAVDPRPASAAAHLDVPAYRYQRILYPLVARGLAGGQPGLIPWSLLAVNLVAQVAGTMLVQRLLAAHGASPWYALSYGLFAGLVMAVRLDLNEPLSYALVAGALLAHHYRRRWLAGLLLVAAALAKETAIVFLAALLASAVLQRDRRAALIYLLAGLPLAAWQLVLLQWFGSAGLGAGGYMATPFEVVPFLGFLRIAAVSVPAFVLLGAILGPLVVLPSLWGIAAAALRLANKRDYSPAVLALGANAAMLAFTPFSTFREPLGLVRLAAGLVLATLAFGAERRSARVLRYSLFWMSALALIIRE